MGKQARLRKDRKEIVTTDPDGKALTAQAFEEGRERGFRQGWDAMAEVGLSHFDPVYRLVIAANTLLATAAAYVCSIYNDDMLREALKPVGDELAAMLHQADIMNRIWENDFHITPIDSVLLLEWREAIAGFLSNQAGSVELKRLAERKEAFQFVLTDIRPRFQPGAVTWDKSKLAWEMMTRLESELPRLNDTQIYERMIGELNSFESLDPVRVELLNTLVKSPDAVGWLQQQRKRRRRREGR